MFMGFPNLSSQQPCEVYQEKTTGPRSLNSLNQGLLRSVHFTLKQFDWVTPEERCWLFGNPVCSFSYLERTRVHSSGH